MGSVRRAREHDRSSLGARREAHVPAWQPWAALAGFALLLHFVWEMVLAPFYDRMATAAHWGAVVECARATVGDAAITLVAYGAAALWARDRLWLAETRASAVIVILGAGLAIAVALEWLNLRVGR